jgi:hypothetical protein
MMGMEFGKSANAIPINVKAVLLAGRLSFASVSTLRELVR